MATTILDLSSSYGGIFITTFIAASLWGISCAQTFTYFINYPGDIWLIKSVVFWLWIMDTAHQIVVIKGLYSVLISKFGGIEAITVLRPEFSLQIIFTVLVSSVAQLFFTYRIWRFSGKRWVIPAVLVSAVVAQFVTQLIYMGSLLHNPTLGQIRATGSLAIGFNSTAAATDVGIAIAMVYLLLQEHTGYEPSSRMISFLVFMSVNSGFWTAAVALGVVITVVAIPPPNLVFGAIYTCLSPLYCNTVLANLNSRNYIRQTGGQNSSLQTESLGISQHPDTYSRCVRALPLETA